MVKGGEWNPFCTFYTGCEPVSPVSSAAVKAAWAGSWVSQHWSWEAASGCMCFFPSTPPPNLFAMSHSHPSLSMCLLPDSQVCKELSLPPFPPSAAGMACVPPLTTTTTTPRSLVLHPSLPPLPFSNLAFLNWHYQKVSNVFGLNLSSFLIPY